MEPHKIQYAIHEADISHGAALEGDCGPIARALKNVFGGTYVVVYDADGNPRHAAVKIDDQLYDGTGQTSPESLHSMFVHGTNCTRKVECNHLQERQSLDEFRVDRALRSQTEDALEQ